MSNNQQADSHDNIEARRQRLRALRDRLRPERAQATSSAPAETAGPEPDAAPPAAGGGGGGGFGQVPGGFGGDRSRYLANLLLNTLRMRDDENTPTLPGTAFTAEGITRMLDGLKSRGEMLGAGGRGLALRLHGYLTRPAKDGEEMLAGANKESLTRFVNFLTQMQSQGWDGVREQLMAGTGPGRDLLEGFASSRMEQLEDHIKGLEATIETLKQQIADLTAADAKPAAKTSGTRSRGKAAAATKAKSKT